MKLTSYIVARDLREKFGQDAVHAFLHSDPRDLALAYPLLYDRALVLRGSVLYVVDAAEFPQACRRAVSHGIERISFLVVGELHAVDMGERIDVVFLGAGRDAAQALNEVISLFGRYDAWRRLLESRVEEGELVDDVVAASLGAIGNDVWVLDSDNILVCKRSFPQVDEEWERTFTDPGRKRFAPSAIINQQGVPLEPQGSSFTQVGYFGEVGRVPCVAGYFGLPNNYGVKICILEHARPIDPADMGLVEVLARYVLRVYTDVRKKEPPIKTHGLTPLFKRIVQGKEANVHGAAHALAQLGWEAETACYECYCLDYVYEVSHATGFEVKPFGYLRGRLQALFPCVVFQYDHCLVAVVNVALVEGELAEAKGRVLRLLEENRCVCGVSDPFTDILELRGAYRQAQEALEIGAKQTSGNLFHFRDIVGKYVIESVLRDMQPAHLVDPRLFDLIAFDKEHDLDLYGTLEAYVQNNFKVANTCRVLYLQRNSLVYRLNRVEQVTGFDLDDPSTRFLLQLYLMVLNEYGT